MKAQTYHVFYSAIERSVSVLFENEKKLAEASITMSLDMALDLGRDLTNVLNPASENDSDQRPRAADNPEQ